MERSERAALRSTNFESTHDAAPTHFYHAAAFIGTIETATLYVPLDVPVSPATNIATMIVSEKQGASWVALCAVM
jgi:hypothetical protein